MSPVDNFGSKTTLYYPLLSRSPYEAEDNNKWNTEKSLLEALFTLPISAIKLSEYTSEELIWILANKYYLGYSISYDNFQKLTKGIPSKSNEIIIFLKYSFDKRDHNLRYDLLIYCTLDFRNSGWDLGTNKMNYLEQLSELINSNQISYDKQKRLFELLETDLVIELMEWEYHIPYTTGKIRWINTIYLDIFKKLLNNPNNDIDKLHFENRFLKPLHEDLWFNTLDSYAKIVGITIERKTIDGMYFVFVKDVS